MYEQTSTGDPEARRCCKLPAGASVVGTVWFEVPKGLSVSSLFWNESFQLQVTIS